MILSRLAPLTDFADQPGPHAEEPEFEPIPRKEPNPASIRHHADREERSSVGRNTRFAASLDPNQKHGYRARVSQPLGSKPSRVTQIVIFLANWRLISCESRIFVHHRESSRHQAPSDR